VLLHHKTTHEASQLIILSSLVELVEVAFMAAAVVPVVFVAQ
jgi:hypothetical protein